MYLPPLLLSNLGISKKLDEPFKRVKHIKQWCMVEPVDVYWKVPFYPEFDTVTVASDAVSYSYRAMSTQNLQKHSKLKRIIPWVERLSVAGICIASLYGNRHYTAGAATAWALCHAYNHYVNNSRYGAIKNNWREL